MSKLAKRSDGLVVHGSGYASPFQMATSSRRTATQPSSITAARNQRPTVQKKPPFVSACGGGGSSLRRSGSAGSIPSAVATPTATPPVKRRIPLQLPQSQSGFLGRQQLHQERVVNARRASSGTTTEVINCSCQHPADVSFLQDVYVNNLQTQIEVLELENSYLRGGAPPSGFHHHPRPILKEDSKVDSAASRQETTNSSQQRLSKVQFVETETADKTSFVNNHQPSEREKLGNGDFHHQALSTAKLDQAHQIQISLEAKLASQLAENRELTMTKERLEQRLSSIQQTMDRERRSLMEENVEMRRRLDELTPLLAEKEAKMARLEKEKDASVTQLKKSNLQLHSLQARIDERQREESLFSELDSDRRLEIEKLREQVRHIERHLRESGTREMELRDEVAMLQEKLAECRRLKEEEKKKIKEGDSRECHALRRENSELNVHIKKLEEELNRYYAEKSSRRGTEADRLEVEVEELRRKEKSAQAELAKCEERLKRERKTVEFLTQQVREKEAVGRDKRDARLTRIQKELEGLQALSASLTEENRGLREEKIAFEEKIVLVERKLRTRDDDVSELRKEVAEFKQRFDNTQQRLRTEVERHSEMEKQLENIVKKVDRLSDSQSSQRRSGYETSVVAVRRVEEATSKSATTIERGEPSRIASKANGAREQLPSGRSPEYGRPSSKSTDRDYETLLSRPPHSPVRRQRPNSSSHPGSSRTFYPTHANGVTEDERSSSEITQRSVPSNKAKGRGTDDNDGGELADESEIADSRFRKFRRKMS